MRRTLTSSPELFSDLSWDLLLKGEETAKKWKHDEFNIEHVVQTLFTSNKFINFVDNLSIDQDIVLDITENFLADTKTSNSDILTIGEDLELVLDEANHIKTQWGSNLIEIPHLLIAIAKDDRLGYYVFEQGNLSLETLETEVKNFPIFNNIKNSINTQRQKVKNLPNESLNERLNNYAIQKSSGIALSKNENKNIELMEDTSQQSVLSIYAKDLTAKAQKLSLIHI